MFIRRLHCVTKIIDTKYYSLLRCIYLLPSDVGGSGIWSKFDHLSSDKMDRKETTDDILLQMFCFTYSLQFYL